MSNILRTLQSAVGPTAIRQHEPLGRHTSHGIGGLAEYYLAVEKTDDLIRVLPAAAQVSLPVFIFGSGSHIIFSDTEIKGLVIKNNCRKFEIASMKGIIKNRQLDVRFALVSAEAGVPVNQLVRFTLEQGLGGLEYFLGLPGTIGGAISMGATFPKNNTNIRQALHEVTALTKEGVRHQGTWPGDVILSVLFHCTPFDKTVLWERGTQAVRYRNDTAPNDTQAIHVFRNISLSQAMRIPTPEYTTSPAYLIEQIGLQGKQVGDAFISDTHPNYIVNKGNATASDVLALIAMIKDGVFKQFGVTLEMEVKIVGEV